MKKVFMLLAIASFFSFTATSCDDTAEGAEEDTEEMEEEIEEEVEH